MPTRPLLRLLVLTVVSTSLVVGVGSLASAHAELDTTSPASGARLDSSPPAIELRFTEPVQVLDDAVTLLTQTGEEVALAPATVDGAVVSAEVPPLDDGGYVVDWQVVSADGHPITGAFAFAVGDAAPPDVDAAGTSGDEGDLLWLWRAVTYAGFATVLGIWAFVVACWWRGRDDRVLANLLTAGALVALGGAVARVLTEASVLDIAVGDTLELRSGKAWWLLVALAVLLLATRPLLATAPSRGPAAAGWCVATLGVGLAIAYAGHGSGGRMPSAGTALTVVHVAAASVWTGGLVALVRALRAPDVDDRSGVVARFSSIALGTVAVLAATGVLQAVRVLEEVDALVDSDYGRALLVKLAVVAVLVATAAVSRRQARRLAADDASGTSHASGTSDASDTSGTSGTSGTTLRRLVAVEVALAVLALATTGWLAGESPTVTEATSSGGPATVTVADEASGTTATVEVDPSRTGPNGLAVRVSRAGAPVQEVTLDLGPFDESLPAVRLSPLEVGAGYFVVDPVDMEVPGTWVLTILARFGEFDVVTLTADFVVTGG